MTGEKEPKSTPGNVISVIVVLIISLLLYLPTITSVLSSLGQPEKIGLPLAPYTYSYTFDDLYKYSVKRTGVPDYTAEIYISFEAKNVEVGKTIQFHVEIDDVEERLEKPYFYIFLVNNTGQIVSVFPEETWLSEYNKLPKWSTQNGYLKWSIRGDTLSIPRETLKEGQGDCWKNNIYKDNCDIWYERQIVDDPSQIGRWEIWIFIFDEKYYTSEGKEQPLENAITYIFDFFQVTPKTRPEQAGGFDIVYLWWLSKAFAIIISIYGMFRKVSPWINTHSEQILEWWKRNKRIVVVSIIVLFFNLVLFLLEI